ncbi:MAG TPA: transporter substrate-binding domain-containing protein, partial [Anaerolineales bacterium]
MKTNMGKALRVISILLIMSFLAACGAAPAAPAAAPAAGAAAATNAASATVSSNNTLDAIVKAGTIKIAVPEDTALFGSLGKDGKTEGYDIDIANMLAKDLGVKAELVPVSSANRIPYLTSGKVDLVVA